MKPKLIPAVAAERLITGGPTGLIWSEPPNNRVKPGEPAGRLKTCSRYYQTGLGGLRFLNHRIVWFLETGEQPPEFLDHINGDGKDNRIDNLRPATRAQNGWNTPIPSHNTSGFKGVYYVKDRDRFAARSKLNGKLHHLGLYTTPEEASEVYIRFINQHHGDFANHG